ncbi:MAG: hypothetical protein ACOC1P_03060, partial [Minisyncoccales bacterium]
MKIIYYLNPFNWIKEVFFPNYSYLKKDNKELNYLLKDSETFEEDILKKSEKISPEDLRPTDEEKRNIEERIQEIRRQHTPGEN